MLFTKMHKFAVFSFVSGLILGCDGANVLVSSRSASRIVGGQDVEITELPHQLSLENYGNHMCGASILASSVAVTAAHCVVGSYQSGLRLRAGTSIREYGGTIHPVSEIVVHPLYASEFDYDVALLFVDVNFRYDATTQPISMCSTEPVSGMLTVSGWGTTTENGELSEQLQAVTIPIVNRTDCNAIYAPYGGITERMFCAGSAGHDACQGDSGGPIIRGEVLYGLVSWGKGCAEPGYPGVFVNLANPDIRNWINSIAGVY